ncbi:polysaccharide biosynthesis tyrosine autokinase [Gramella sp. GC03-9]|uniref:non-specific protein-tyrosine kinase n=1 Tax=Christiangramia oceanisediminis TaxID=2920386 RepID=A0A9X2KVW1_9FLAO|nr:tyrosine-protein kinase [Gramella oceanisediminis]MCP9199587.1 polysaccharide biosynthesis tyrosine autokinase [Gramella oceanisediminis]
MSYTDNNSVRQQVRKFNLRKELQKYLKYWYWFVIGVILSVIGGVTYVRYSTPVYSASASIIINEESGSGSSSEMLDVGLAAGLKTNNLEKEIAILKSRRLMKRVVKALDLNISYYIEGQVRDVELYKDLPFDLKILKFNENEEQGTGGGSFEISYSKGKLSIIDLSNLKEVRASPDSPIDLGFTSVVIHPENGVENFSPIIVNFTDLEKAADRYRTRLQVFKAENNSNVINLVLEDPVVEKAKDVIDQVIFEFNRDAIEDKNLLVGNSANFINDRLDIINDELEYIESGKEEFKESNRLTDIQSESQMFVQTASEYNQKRQEVGTQLELVNAMLDYLSSSSNSELLPANLGIQESAVNSQIAEYNDLVLQRNRIMKSSTELNPAVISINDNVTQIKSNILQSLQRLRNNLQISQNDLSRQVQSIGSKILAVPSQEREYRGIERQQNIKEALYLFLLQKREENSLELAVTAPKAKIVDNAFSSGFIVSPNSRSILLGSVILGLFLPFSVIYVRDLLDNKIRNREDVEEITRDISIIGELPAVKNKEDLQIEHNDHSMLSEAFRFLITNLHFLLVNSDDQSKGKNILVTSTIKGEGKTFTALNLALILSYNDKKVLLVGADLRNPKLNEYQKNKSTGRGLSDYLANAEQDIRNLIKTSKFNPNLEILGSGSIPPNPSELLRQKKLDTVLTDLKKEYDYVIIDSAPTMLVTDTLLLNKYADATLFVIKANFTDKDVLNYVLESNKRGVMPNVSFILNNVSKSDLGFGNKYGYGYMNSKKSAFQWRAFLPF